MFQVLVAVVPVFAVIAVGYGVAWIALVRETIGPWLARLVFNFLLPLLVFRTLATGHMPDGSPWALWGAYFGGCLLTWIAAHQVARRVLGAGGQSAVLIGFGGSYSNVLLLSLSLVYRLYGDVGALPLFILLSLHLPVMLFAAMVQLEWAAAPGETSIGAVIGKVVLATLKNPIMVALFAGLIYRQTGTGLDANIDQALKLVGQVALPGALFSLGISLKAYGSRSDLPTTGVIMGFKLFVLPLLVWLLARYVFALPDLWVTVATLSAAAPTGVNVYLFAARHQVAVGAVSGAIAFGTAVSALTITALLLLGFFHPPLL